MIKVWNYLNEYAEEKGEVLAAIEKVLNSGWLIMGESLKAFEQAFAAYCGVKHGIGVDNGTNSLTLALKAMGIQAGDEVITVSNTAVPTVCAIVNAGGIPRFVDIERDTYLMDVRQVESAITSRTRFLLPVHLYGQNVEMETLIDIARHHGLKVLEDCAQSHGALRHGKKSGAFGDASSFSFYPTKLLGTFGDGGMVCTDQPEIDAKMRRLRFYGMEKTYYALEHGYNSRLDEMHAEILLRRLPLLDAKIARRRALASRYDRELTGTGLVLPVEKPGNMHAYYLYVARHPRRDDIIARLKQHDIAVNVSYPYPIHTMEGYAFLGGRQGQLPETEAAAREIFSLPMYPGLTDEEQARVISALRAICAGL